MSVAYAKGSEWRKWDLHVHLPCTKLSNGYKKGKQDIPWEAFCDAVESSDVMAFGLTDYFSVQGYFEFINRFNLKYPKSTKCFFPNIELRLNEGINKQQQEVNIHLILRDTISKIKIEEFLSKLKTEITDSRGRKLSCLEIDDDEIEAAVVTRSSIMEAFEDTFGSKAIRQEYMLIITAANNDGIRIPSGHKRKANLNDEIDKFSDAFFGGSQNTSYFLGTDRLEDKNQKIRPKPVFSGSDAHNFQQFEDWVGRTVLDKENSKEITWIKADPTYEGLLQTLIEPKNRVTVQAIQPDTKEPYKTIRSVTFSNSPDFPVEPIELNNNLCSIIGARSSGKSALLAYIAYAIDPQDTLTKQLATGVKENEAGPAAGLSWKDVASLECRVEWASGEIGGGKVVYIPQNYLYSISSRPSEITNKIKPVLFSKFPDIESLHEKTVADLEASSQAIGDLVNQWFDLRLAQNDLLAQLRELGNKSAVTAARKNYQNQIEELKVKLSLTEQEIKDYQEVTTTLTQKRAKIEEINKDGSRLLPFIKKLENGNVEPSELNVSVLIQPSIDSLPSELTDRLKKEVKKAETDLSTSMQGQILDYRSQLLRYREALHQEISKILIDNKTLIERNEQNKQLEKLVAEVNKQDSILAKITEKEKQIKTNRALLIRCTSQIKIQLEAREKYLKGLEEEVSKLDQEDAVIKFNIEYDYDLDARIMMGEKFNRQNSSSYLDELQQAVEISSIRSDPSGFLEAIYTGKQKIKTGLIGCDVAKELLSSAEEIRYAATMEGDRIGGFIRSSMTPGRRALFALTLILNEIDGAWPLLIDQPEDDLDSRSIYEQIVPYIIERKRERQIIMVSHDANLVIGADSEQVIVANQHGDDRKNKKKRTFDYLTGALEYSKAKTEAEFTLEACGVREHACEILDGGTEAFEKRKDKYRL